ncbi:HIRAN domain-containing protein [Achromobacter spanius]|uniref:HIRAN domain-containing protein n=1 Tax=Achromobacter spanius TaxID=217203 RepID=UPI0032081087
MALRTMVLRITGFSHGGRAQALRQFARVGGKARIERDRENAADPNAIAIRIAVDSSENGELEWVLIGYLEADRSAILAPLFDKNHFQKLRFVLRVQLPEDGERLPAAVLELTYEVGDGDPDADMRAARASRLVAELDELRWDNIEATRDGEGISLWRRPDTTFIHAYRRGAVGGKGAFLGSTSDPRLAQYDFRGLRYTAEIHRAGARAWITVLFG